MNRYPSINVIIPTLNEEENLERCLKPIFRQNYPKEKLKVTIVDGGSKDSTVKIAKKYRCEILLNKEKLGGHGLYRGIKNSDCDLCCAFAADNIIANDRNFFIKMIIPFIEKNVTGAFPKVIFSKNEPPINKYINYRSEPFSEFIYGKACNSRTFKEVYHIKYGNEDYVIYNFHSRNFPLIALAQGFMINKRKFKLDTKAKLSDIQPIIDIIKRGEDIAYVKTANIFHYQIMSLKSFIKKFEWRIRNNLDRTKIPEISIRKEFSSKKLLWVFYSISFILPLFYSLYSIIQTKKKFYIYHFVTNVIILFLIPYMFFKVKLGRVRETYKWDDNK